MESIGIRHFLRFFTNRLPTFGRIGLRTEAGGPLNNRLKELRLARGLTLAQLAEATGASNQQISHLENGRRRFSVEWLTRLATPLNCHPLEILEGEALATNPQERKLLTLFRKLTAEQQDAFLRTAISLIEPEEL